MIQADRIVVVGGGVVGLTVALALELEGHPTVITTDGRDATGARSPAADVASLHAAASILPHSVRGPRTTAWTTATARVLDSVMDNPSWGVRIQTHLELFEVDHLEPPKYASALDRFTLVDPRHDVLPRRGADIPLSGWSFNARFCEAQRYLRRLRDLYVAVGGSIDTSAPVTLAKLVARGVRHVVNCTGHRGPRFAAEGATSLTDSGPLLGLDPLADPFDIRFIVGHYLRVERDRLLRGGDGSVLSYNYTPSPDVYSDASGRAADVYCYPRSDAWLLGGSRIAVEGDLDAAHAQAAAPSPSVVMLPDAQGRPQAIPSAIVDLNHELLGNLTGGMLDLRAQIRDEPSSAWVGYGLRAERADPESSTRVACSAVTDGATTTMVAHCYGHGGSGFTLSWGSAVEVVARMRRAADAGRGPMLPKVHPPIGRAPSALIAAVAAATDRT